MARPVMLSNGSMLVGLNEQGLVHDFYYPYIGLENLTTSRSSHHLIGVWVENKFSWLDDGSWEITVNFSADALVSDIFMRSDKLDVVLRVQDFVDSEINSFSRIIHVTNTANHQREVRVFMHQVFQISRAGRADTALYVPDDNYILDYKGRVSLLIYGQKASGEGFDQFAIGSYGIEGKEGTFRDAEDGDLSGSPVEHGGVDSVIRFCFDLKASSEDSLHYWIIAADSQYSAEKLHKQYKKDGILNRLESTKEYWHEWLGLSANQLHAVDAKYLDIAKKSLMMIKAHIDKRGGIIASCDSSIYNYGRDYYSYVWPRDGAYAIWPLIRMGMTAEAQKFFEFCRDILTEDGYLMHKYQPDRAIGSTWHPLLHGKRKELAIQEDETAIVVYMLSEYWQYSGDVEFVKSMYSTLVQPACDFLTTFMDEDTGLPHASYDLWEEKFLTSTYTTAITYQALLAGADMAELLEAPDDALRWREVAAKILKNSSVFFDNDRKAFRKGFLLQEDKSLKFDNTIDISSLYGVMMYGLHGSDIDQLKQNIATVENLLLDKSPSGGSPRYEHDHYFASEPPYMGNPWFVTTLWLAQYYIRSGDIAKASHYLDWTMEHAMDSGALSEQVNPSNGMAVGVAPLVWSHAEVVNTILDVTKARHAE